MHPYGLMADIHLHDWSAFSHTLPDGQNNRLAGLLGEIMRCAEEVQKAGGQYVVIAGDVFHVRGSVAPSVLNPARDALKFCTQVFGTRFVILAGNHDLQHKEASRMGSAITALEGPYVQVINEPTYLPELNMVLVPWIESIDELKATIENLGAEGVMSKSEFKRSHTDLILHAPIDGVIKGLPAHGLTPEYLADLGYKRVAAGHYHNHKLLYPGSSGAMTSATDVYSIGGLAHHTWSDVGTKAGYLMMSPDRVDWRKSHLPEFIDLSQLTELEPEELPLLVDGNFVRVKVEASKTKEVEKARQELLDMGAKAVLVQAQPKPPAREGADGTLAPTVASGASLEVSVADFVKGMFKGTDLILGIAPDVTKAALAVLASVDAKGD